MFKKEDKIFPLLVLCGVWESRGGATTSSHKDMELCLHRQQTYQILLTSYKRFLSLLSASPVPHSEVFYSGFKRY